MAGMASAGFLVWLHRLQPVFVATAVVSLGYAHAMMWSRQRRGQPVGRFETATVWFSTVFYLAILLGWAWLWLRYQ